MNIVIAVILEAYNQSSLETKAIVKQEDFRAFTAKWAEFDPDGDEKIPFAHLQQFMKDLPYPMGFKAEHNQKNINEINEEAKNFVDAKVCVMSAPTIENDEDNENEKEIKTQREKRLQEIEKIVKHSSSLQLNQEIDKMGIRPYEENGDAIVRFRDVLFACVQRSYKEMSTLRNLAKKQIGAVVDDDDDDDEGDAFSISEDHKSRIDAEKKGKQPVKISLPHYHAALAIAQAYRAHTFRNKFLAKAGVLDTNEEHLKTETVDTQVDSA